MKIDICDHWFKNISDNAFKIAKSWCIWALKVVQEFVIWRLVACKLVAYKKIKGKKRLAVCHMLTGIYIGKVFLIIFLDDVLLSYTSN